MQKSVHFVGLMKYVYRNAPFKKRKIKAAVWRRKHTVFCQNKSVAADCPYQ